MTESMQRIKLSMIAGLTAGECEGWRLGLSLRAPFDGEIAALTAREKALEVRA